MSRTRTKHHNGLQTLAARHVQRSSGGVFLPSSNTPSGSWIEEAIARGASVVFLLDSQANASQDRSGSGYHSTPPGGTYTASFKTGGPLGTFCDMAGFADAWDWTDNEFEFLETDEFSVELIARVPPGAATQILAGSDSGVNGSRGWVVQVDAAGDLQAFANNQAGPVIESTGLVLDDDEWHHIVFTHSWTTGHTNHWVDGVQTRTNASGSTSKQTHTNMTYGGRGPATSIFQGDLQAFAFYAGVVLDATDVAALYNDSGIQLLP